MPPPGGWSAPGASSTSAPPRPGPPAGYPLPPPGWYPGAPVPRKRPRRAWLIVLCIVVPVLALAAIALVVARGVDPGAAKDRDAAEAALLTNADLGGTFSETAHRTFARSRGGLRVEGDLAECGASNGAFEKSGQAVVDPRAAGNGQPTRKLRIIDEAFLITPRGSYVRLELALEASEEIMVVDSPSSATQIVDSIVDTAPVCVEAAVHKNPDSAGVGVAMSPAAAPALGDRAAAFEGSLGGGGRAAELDIVVVQQGRAILLIFTIDTTGSLSRQIDELAGSTLTRLVPRFGS